VLPDGSACSGLRRPSSRPLTTGDTRNATTHQQGSSVGKSAATGRAARAHGRDPFEGSHPAGPAPAM